MAIGWVANTADADNWFAKRGDSSAWTPLTVVQKTAFLWDAFYRLVDCPDYNLAETTPATNPLKRAQTEMAYYMVKHLSAEDHRVGLIVQSVRSAGIVQETYGDKMLPIPPEVNAILVKAGYQLKGWEVAAIARDENEDIDVKIDEYSEQE